MRIEVTSAPKQFRKFGYTHEYAVFEKGWCIRVGITKGMTFRKLRQLLAGQRLDRP